MRRRKLSLTSGYENYMPEVAPSIDPTQVLINLIELTAECGEIEKEAFNMSEALLDRIDEVASIGFAIANCGKIEDSMADFTGDLLEEIAPEFARGDAPGTVAKITKFVDGYEASGGTLWQWVLTWWNKLREWFKKFLTNAKSLSGDITAMIRECDKIKAIEKETLKNSNVQGYGKEADEKLLKFSDHPAKPFITAVLKIVAFRDKQQGEDDKDTFGKTGKVQIDTSDLEDAIDKISAPSGFEVQKGKLKLESDIKDAARTVDEHGYDRGSIKTFATEVAGKLKKLESIENEIQKSIDAFKKTQDGMKENDEETNTANIPHAGSVLTKMLGVSGGALTLTSTVVLKLGIRALTMLKKVKAAEKK